jgi:hypothetical protein
VSTPPFDDPDVDVTEVLVFLIPDAATARRVVAYLVGDLNAEFVHRQRAEAVDAGEIAVVLPATLGAAMLAEITTQLEGDDEFRTAYDEPTGPSGFIPEADGDEDPPE